MKIVKAKNQKLTVSCKILRKSNALDNNQLRQVFMTPKKAAHMIIWTALYSYFELTFVLAANALNKDCSGWLVIHILNRVGSLAKDNRFNTECVDNANAGTDLPVDKRL